ncbi:MAG: sporulation protein YabP [Limnochordaceae bacterium]|uniref:Sporulation protein YabP n=1 Tax=Carboxydichorda subterranea TaxID=3109565 RepID=A0ABZ1BWF0_9FIRM|nr:sporulation protein YabP [Limnochorda sp. L945t]MBE3599534.1 sporulation protein YabP [Limnochordaceae bacterium]WRP17009.1 sporulation protein YabP [Limnochorda sp. L945t]
MAERGEQPGQVRHQLLLKGRQQLELQGVLSVDSFDEQVMTLQTDAGTLIIRGEGMQIHALDVDQGTMAVTGLVHSLEYAQEAAKRRVRGILRRLTR